MRCSSTPGWGAAWVTGGPKRLIFQRHGRSANCFPPDELSHSDLLKVVCKICSTWFAVWPIKQFFLLIFSSCPLDWSDGKSICSVISSLGAQQPFHKVLWWFAVSLLPQLHTPTSSSLFLLLTQQVLKQIWSKDESKQPWKCWLLKALHLITPAPRDSRAPITLLRADFHLLLKAGTCKRESNLLTVMLKIKCLEERTPDSL